MSYALIFCWCSLFEMSVTGNQTHCIYIIEISYFQHTILIYIIRLVTSRKKKVLVYWSFGYTLCTVCVQYLLSLYSANDQAIAKRILPYLSITRCASFLIIPWLWWISFYLKNYKITDSAKKIKVINVVYFFNLIGLLLFSKEP